MTAKTLKEWSRAAESVTPHNDILIDGEWRESRTGERFDTVNPATGETITEVASGQADDINDAAQSARAAFEDGRWSGLAPRDRGQALIKLAELIDAHG
ncbi:MAG: aldehyde dehydrogenase family protein, partial [Actinomycetota bacterium]